MSHVGCHGAVLQTVAGGYSSLVVQGKQNTVHLHLHLADTLIQSDLQWVQGHSPEASRVKCLAQGHNVIGRESSRQPSDYWPDSLTAQPPESTYNRYVCLCVCACTCVYSHACVYL